MFKKLSIILYALVMVLVVILDPFFDRSAYFPTDGKHLNVALTRGNFVVFDFHSRRSPPSAVIIFGSGDGGWSRFEETICHAFQNRGYEVIGIDCNRYARTEYTLDILQSDYGKIAQTVLATFGKHPPPLIVGGYSMGAAQAIAVVGGPHPPHGLIGLLVIDPLSRGRYGLHLWDQLNVLPSGPGTFGVDDFSRTMGSLRVVQWHAENDSIDSRAWLAPLTAPHKLFTFPGAGHTYLINQEDFSRQLVNSAQWIVQPQADVTLRQKP